MNVAPGATYEAVIDWGATGATLGMRVLDNAGATTVSRLTGFTEYPAGSGVYYRDGNTAPATAGDYTLLYDDDGGTAAVGHVATDDLLVTSSANLVSNTGSLYVTRDQLKATLELTDETYADDDIDQAVSAASRVIDRYKNARFYPTTETRYYTADRWCLNIDIDDINTLTSLAVDVDGNGSYETTWTSGTDFVLDPPNAAADGVPYNRVCILVQSGRVFPTWQRAVQIIGSFGWAATPPQVTQAATILAARYLKRARETPYGIVFSTTDTGTSAQALRRTDPDVAFLLDDLGGDVPQLFA